MAKTEPIGLLEYDFGPAVRAFSTTRSGMEGTGQYAGFNLLHRGQPAPPHVRRNRERLCARLGIGEERLVIPQQTHGTRVAVVSTTEHRLVVTALGRVGLLDLVDLVVGGDDVTRHKPDPEPYARALKALGIAAHEAVAFEDSPSGVASAQAAGVHTLGYTGSSVPQDLSAADELFSTFELLRL